MTRARRGSGGCEACQTHCSRDARSGGGGCRVTERAAPSKASSVALQVRWSVFMIAVGFGVVLPKLPDLTELLLGAASELCLNLVKGV